MSDATAPTPPAKTRSSPTYFFLRGLAIILPPVLTVAILLWVANAFNTYIIYPVNTAVRFAVALATNDIRDEKDLEPPPPEFPALPEWKRQYRISRELAEMTRQLAAVTAELLETEPYVTHVYVPMGSGPNPNDFVPLADYNLVFKQLRPQPPPRTAMGLYMEIAATKFFHTAWQLSAMALSITIIVLYFLGRFVSARIGRWFVHKLESLLTRVPLVHNVYSTVKQVTDFVLSDREVEFRRVVAVEYPRAGSWTLGFVTGEGMAECAAAVGEPMLTVLIPTSPVPAGGFTIMVPRSQVIDIDMTVDQALQFVVSCGVLTPPNQQTNLDARSRGLDSHSNPPVLISSEPATGRNGGNGQ